MEKIDEDTENNTDSNTGVEANGQDDGMIVETRRDIDVNKKMMKYLKSHPEINLIITELYNAVITKKPHHIARFLADEFFGNPEYVAKWTSNIGIINTAVTRNL